MSVAQTWRVSHRSTLCAWLALLSVLTVVLLPAQARANAPFVNEHFTIDDSGAFSDCGFRIRVHNVGSGAIKLRTEPGSGEELVQQRLDITSTFTNPVTGDWFAIAGHWQEHISHTTVLPNGNIETVLREPGNRHNIYDADGVIARDTGQTVYTFVYDPVLDEEVSMTTEVHGKFPVAGTDLCVLATDLIG
ncbi:MAG TPA: hypothetical protein VMT88_12850 [Actinomycetes bacterium]|nr:hypothetical protein [Actinomycetes bacterium]